MAYDLSDYEPVADRISKFWAKYPNGRIITRIVELNATGVIVEASIFTDRDDTRPAAVDHAHETIGGKGVNVSSWLENACTSSIGRSLATLNFASSKQRASREEMAKVNRTRNWLAEAEVLAASKDIEKLRAFWQIAAKAGATEDVLNEIAALATKLAG